MQFEQWQEIDWNEVFMRQMGSSDFIPKLAENWSERAAEMAQKWDPNSDYMNALIDKAGLREFDSLLDVGCGTGALLRAVAPDVHSLVGMDFSEGMLREARRLLDETGVGHANLLPLSWQDDWSEVPEVDAVISSRSFGVYDARDALEKMNSKARKKAALTYRVSGFVCDDVLAVLGRPHRRRPDYIVILNLLYQMGIAARVDFIQTTTGQAAAPDPDSLVGRLQWTLGALTAHERQLLEQNFSQLPRNDEGDVMYGPPARWALIQWEIP